MSISLIFGFVIFVVLVMITLAMGGLWKKNRLEQESGDEMLKNAYVYLVSFATLMMTIGGTVAAFMAVADIVSPPPYYQSFDMFKQEYRSVQTKYNDKGMVIQQPDISEVELQKSYEQRVNEERIKAKERAVNSLIKSFGWIIIPFPVFIYFQRRVKEKKIVL